MGKVKAFYHDEIESAMRETRWFRANNESDKLMGAKIDAEKGIIYGMSSCSEGNALGHGVWLDSSFISDLTNLGQSFKVGVKSRFGHPAMSGESLGTYIGRCKNFRVEGSKSICDLHFDDSSEVTPSGNLKDYLLKLAETSPDMFGASIVFSVGAYYYKKTSGEKITTSDHYNNQDEGKVDYNLEIDEFGNTKYYISIKELHGVDLVDEPAANADGLFSSNNLHADKFAVIASKFLESNPKIVAFLKENPHKISEFMKKFNAKNEGEKPLESDEEEDILLSDSEDIQNDDDAVEIEDTEEDAEVNSTKDDTDAAIVEKLSKAVIKAFDTRLSAIEKRLKDIEESPTADPSFSTKKKDSELGKTKPQRSWDKEWDARYGKQD